MYPFIHNYMYLGNNLSTFSFKLVAGGRRFIYNKIYLIIVL